MALSVRTRLVRSLILRWGLLRRAMTLGVRVLVEDGEGRILLVRHTYVPGWHFPGGAVDPGESAEAAAIRELREETGVTLSARPALVGLYRNTAAAGRDNRRSLGDWMRAGVRRQDGSGGGCFGECGQERRHGGPLR